MRWSINSKSKFFIVVIFLCSIWAVIVLTIFSVLSLSSRVKISSAVEAQIRLSVTHEGYDQVVRFFSQLERLELVYCVELEIEESTRVSRKLIRATESSCHHQWWRVFSNNVNSTITTPDQKNWIASYRVADSSSSYLYMYSILGIGILGIVFVSAMWKTLKEEQEKMQRREDEIKNRYYLEARRYAHDIRSPLSAFNAVAFSLRDSNVECSELIGLALEKIRNLTDIFLEGIRGNGTDNTLESLKFSDLVKTIREEIEQKKFEFQKVRNQEVIIILDDPSEKDIPMVQIPSKIFLSRTISNILNNSIESIATTGKIVVTIDLAKEGLELSFEDNGVGIPDKILKKLGSEIITTKKNGNGYGILDINHGLRRIGGKLLVKSSHHGTKLTIFLPFIYVEA